MEENTTNPKALLNVKELCAYLGIDQTKARECRDMAELLDNFP